MLTKRNRQFLVFRLALLALVLVLTGLAMVPSATAVECTYPSTRTIWVDPHCCTGYPPVTDRTAQNQVCCADGTWVNDGAPYCKPAPFCML